MCGKGSQPEIVRKDISTFSSPGKAPVPLECFSPSVRVFQFHQVAGIDRQHAEECFTARIAGGSNGSIWSS